MKQYKVVGGYSASGFDYHCFATGTIITKIEGTDEEDDHDAEYEGVSAITGNKLCQFLRATDVEEVVAEAILEQAAYIKETH